MVIKGSAMTNFETDSNYLALDLDPSNCYLLIFEGITIPVKYPRNEFKTALKKERYFRQDLEPLRQKMWQGTLQLPDGILRVESSEVPGYSMRSFDGVTTLYGDGGWKNSSCLGKKEFSINGNRYVY